MNKQEFHFAMLANDRSAVRQGRWQVLILCAVFSIPILLLFWIPLECRTPLVRYSILAALSAVLSGVLYFGQHIRNRTARRLGLVCPGCGIVFSHLLLRDLGFTNSCGKCGAGVYSESHTQSNQAE
jgi:hypothetical protein